MLKKEGWNVNDFQSSVMTEYDDGNASAMHDPNDAAPAQSLRRHASTYSQYKERGPRGERRPAPSPGRGGQEDGIVDHVTDRHANVRYHGHAPPVARPPDVEYKHRDSYEAPVASAREGFPEDMMVDLYPPQGYGNRHKDRERRSERKQRYVQDPGHQVDYRRQEAEVHDRGAPMDDDTWV